jgi:ABC-type transport system involved in cytochrome c biogenesis permease subunit
MKKWLPLILTVLMGGWFLGHLNAPKDKEFHFNDFGRLPLLFNGRLQPMDSLARNSLLQIREKQTANLEPWKDWYNKPKIIPAIEWLTTVMMKPEVADTWPVFRIDNPELISLLKLPEKDLANKHDGKHFSWNEIKPSLDTMQEQTHRISDREERKQSDPSQRTAFEQAVMNLHGRLVLYMRLKGTVQPMDAKDWPKELAAAYGAVPAEPEARAALEQLTANYTRLRQLERREPAESDPEYQQQLAMTQRAASALMDVAKTTRDGKPFTQESLSPLLRDVARFDGMVGFQPPLLLPPTQHGDHSHNWSSVGAGLVKMESGEPIPAALQSYAAISDAYRKEDVAEFNKQVVMYRASLVSEVDRALLKSGREQLFNRMEPFYVTMVIYLLAFVLACAFWFNLAEPLRRSALWLVVLGLAIHTIGLIFRMWLEGRPPVTNLYSSAIFIGWGAVILGVILEKFYRDGIGLVVASVIGFVTLIIAHHLSLSGDTMEMMRAVLDTNFWLATHVVVVTLGYASTFVAGFLALVYVLRGVFTKTLDEARGKSLARMVYGIICFATLFSFVGTVLGGIWADQSWGRFWGWDPKENGALIIVLWNALVLHLRWGGIVRERGLINCAIVGNIVTSWSWFGVNMLGIGLHSYGFTDAAFFWLMTFVASQLALIGIGCLPLSAWKSFAGRMTGSAPVPARA